MDSSEEGAADLTILKLFLLAPISVFVTQTSTLGFLGHYFLQFLPSRSPQFQSLPPVTQHCISDYFTPTRFGNQP